MRKPGSLIISLFLALAGTGGALAAAPIIDPSKAVEMSGIVTLEKHYGPPNYGETPDKDEVVIVPILILDKPISIRKDEADGFYEDHWKVTKMQLVSMTVSGKWKNFKMKHVLVNGTLFERVSGHHYTEILEDVESIRVTLQR